MLLNFLPFLPEFDLDRFRLEIYILILNFEHRLCVAFLTLETLIICTVYVFKSGRQCELRSILESRQVRIVPASRTVCHGINRFPNRDWIVVFGLHDSLVSDSDIRGGLCDSERAGTCRLSIRCVTGFDIFLRVSKVGRLKPSFELLLDVGECVEFTALLLKKRLVLIVHNKILNYRKL